VVWRIVVVPLSPLTQNKEKPSLPLAVEVLSLKANNFPLILLFNESFV